MGFYRTFNEIKTEGGGEEEESNANEICGRNSMGIIRSQLTTAIKFSGENLWESEKKKKRILVFFKKRENERQSEGNMDDHYD